MGLPTNVSTFTELFKWTNTNSNGIFGTFLLFMIWGIMFMLMNHWEMQRGGDSSKAFLAASFVATLFAIISQTLEVTGNKTLITFIAMTILSGVYVVWTNRGRT